MIRTKAVSAANERKPRAAGAQEKAAKPGKEPISIRLDADILASYRSLGKGWQSRLNDDLRAARGL